MPKKDDFTGVEIGFLYIVKEAFKIGLPYVEETYRKKHREFKMMVNILNTNS